jgi:DNA-binding HxlR family transcriptional regulator
MCSGRDTIKKILVVNHYYFDIVSDMASTTRSYGHFCMLAKALERVGDRWALLVVRDLADGPRRFTDLQERLGGITAKTLSTRLRELETDGLVSVDRAPGRREVWYSLTPAGADLEPVIEDLVYWGLRHALTAPEPGEPAHPEHLLLALRIMLEREHAFVDGAHWLLRLVDDGAYTMRGTGAGWSVAAGAGDGPDVTITTTNTGWAEFLANQPEARGGMAERVRVEGSPEAVATFMGAIATFPFGRSQPEVAVPEVAVPEVAVQKLAGPG